MYNRQVESRILQGILQITQKNVGTQTSIHVKKIQRYGNIAGIQPTIIGKTLAKLRHEGILEPWRTDNRRIYTVNMKRLVAKLARMNKPKRPTR